MKDQPPAPETTEVKIRKWLEIARPAWSYPLERDDAAALIAEIDRLRGIEELYEDACSAAEDRRWC